MNNIQNLLVEIAKDNPDNYLARIIAFYFSKIDGLKDKKAVFDFLIYELDSFSQIGLDELKEKEVDDNIDKYRDKDFRIKSFAISSLRGIPEPDKDGIPFGINFDDDDEVNNAIILANNGVGKSSIFGGLEMVYAQEIGERRLRRSDSDQETNETYREYIERFNSNFDPVCDVTTVDGKFDIENPIFQKELLSSLNPASHFISEYDIIKNGKINFKGDSSDDNSFHTTIARSLGFSDLIDFQSKVEDWNNYRRNSESKDLKETEKSQIENEKTIEQIRKRIIELNIKLKEIDESKASTKKQTSNEDIEKRKSLSDNLEFFRSIKINQEKAEKFVKEFRIFKTYEIENSSISEKDFLLKGRELLKESDNCPLCNDSNLSLKELRSLIDKRIRSVEEQEQSELILNKLFFDVIDNLRDYYKSVRRIKEHIEKEIQLIKLTPELKELLSVEENLKKELENVLLKFESSPILELFDKSNFDRLSRLDLQGFINHWYFKELISFEKDIERFIDVRSKIVTQWSKNNQRDDKKEIKYTLAKDIEELEKQLEGKIEYAKKLKPKIEKAQMLEVRLASIKNYLSDFVNALDDKITELVVNSFNTFKESTEAILNDYLNEQNLQLKIEIRNKIEGELSKKVITAELYNTETKESIAPDIYFNTFRYKLLALMINISITIVTREKYRVNLPLVVDDLFAASDFVSKNSFSTFFSKVLNLFSKYTPDLPLQFILFTHDDIIFRSAMDSIFDPNTRGLNQDLVKQLARNTKVGRIFKPQDKEEKPTLGVEGTHYWNLFFELPKEIKIER